MDEYKPKIKEYLDGKVIDYEVEDYEIILLSDGHIDFYASLPIEHFVKDVYDLPRGTSDPTEVISIGKYCIDELDGIDRYVYDEWDLNDVWEVFNKHKDKVQINSCYDNDEPYLTTETKAD